METTLLIGLLVLMLVWWIVRRRSAKADLEETQYLTTRRVDTTYHAVSIRFEANACQAAKDLEGQRVLASTAPHIPLPGCDVVDCKCRFAHHKDRRVGRDRRTPFGSGGIAAATGKFAAERRESDDRRKEDDDPDFY